MTTDDTPTDYPASWRPRGAPPADEPVALAVDSYLAALSDAEFQKLVARTRGDR